jgi:hypothetical protein
MSFKETWAALPKANKRGAIAGAVFAVWGLVLIVSNAAKITRCSGLAFHRWSTEHLATLR